MWHFLRARYGEGRLGYVNALDMELSKTMVSLAIVAVLRAVELMGLLYPGEGKGCTLAQAGSRLRAMRL